MCTFFVLSSEYGLLRLVTACSLLCLNVSAMNSILLLITCSKAFLICERTKNYVQTHTLFIVLDFDFNSYSCVFVLLIIHYLFIPLDFICKCSCFWWTHTYTCMQCFESTVNGSCMCECIAASTYAPLFALFLLFDFFSLTSKSPLEFGTTMKLQMALLHRSLCVPWNEAFKCICIESNEKWKKHLIILFRKLWLNENHAQNSMFMYRFLILPFFTLQLFFLTKTSLRICSQWRFSRSSTFGYCFHLRRLFLLLASHFFNHDYFSSARFLLDDECAFFCNRVTIFTLSFGF